MKNAWYGHFYAQKLLYFGSKYQNTTIRVQVKPHLFIYFHKLLFEDIKLILTWNVGTESYLPMTAFIISKLYFLPITTKHET